MKLKKFTISLLILLTACSLLFAVGCGSNGGEEVDGIKVVFELEGGTYQNSKLPIEYYFQVGDKEETLIVDPTLLLSSEGVTNQGYALEGWYRTKTGEGENVSYSDKWNFDLDKASASSPLTLYAYWVKKVVFTYSVCYKDGEEVKVLGTYPAVEGSSFDDRNNYANKRNGYTAIGDRENSVLYYDENGDPWDNSFKHPGGETDVDVKVFVNHIKGVFTFVYDKDDLLNAPASRGIYLNDDIDLGGAKLSFTNFARKEFEGNGHTVSNFTIAYDEKIIGNLTDPTDGTEMATSALSVSLFSNLNKSSIRNVTFDNVTVNLTTANPRIKAIYLAPLGITAIDTEILNVTFRGTYVLGSTLDIIPTVSGDLVYKTDSATSVEGSTCTFTQNVQP